MQEQIPWLNNYFWDPLQHYLKNPVNPRSRETVGEDRAFQVVVT